MGTEIIATTIAHLILLAYSVSIRVIHYVFIKHIRQNVNFGAL